ncbi:MAG: hypothetical protein HC915_04540 [Anaerolineae bacterium]|nr:hypothetical protein [Anaerolineae bacterium]
MGQTLEQADVDTLLGQEATLENVLASRDARAALGFAKLQDLYGQEGLEISCAGGAPFSLQVPSASTCSITAFPKMEENRHNATLALNGAVMQMFNHGLSAAGMFLLVGALYHKAHTRDLRRFGGLWHTIPVYGGILVFTSMASLGLPGLNGFIGEYLVVAGSFPVDASNGTSSSA